MNDEIEVLIGAKQVVKEAVAGGALPIKNTTLTEAGVHQEAYAEGEVSFAYEVVDNLGAAIFAKREVVFAKMRDDFAMFVADSSQDRDGFNFDGDFARGLLGRLLAGRVCPTLG